MSLKEGVTDCVFWPRSKTQESSDFVQPPYFFQVTRARKHPVSSAESQQVVLAVMAVSLCQVMSIILQKLVDTYCIHCFLV